MGTNAYHTSDDFEAKMSEFIEQDAYLKEQLASSEKKMPSLHVVPSELPNFLMPQLYQLADVFVLPSRGEGWGRPHVEAMSMGLGIIATGWSGPTSFIEHGVNGWLIRVDELEEIEEGAFRGHRWAKPNVPHLRKLMRNAYAKPEHTRNIIGRNARLHMRNHYCIECIGKRLKNKLTSIAASRRSLIKTDSQ